MSAAVFLKDANGQYLLMNRACRELFNVDDEEIAGLTDDDLFPPEIAEKARKDDRQVIENGEMIELEEELPTATGNTVRLTRKSPVYAENGEIVGLCGVSTDITEQKQREREITHFKERFELALEGANLGSGTGT
ncbi:PAS domain S-box protein [Natrialba swarupiae]|nr:PAS domain S-box protein [Natrialba swarupiae]